MQQIEIIGARKHNLKDINLQIPKRQLVAITGVSGSGKSSLAYDTIFQEGQRRYLESLSIYARQFIKALEKPEVQAVRGISPTISIDQKHASFYYNSTVGTISEVSHYLRLLYAKASDALCPICGRKIERYSFQKILDYIFEEFSGKMVHILAPVVKNRKGTYQALFDRFKKRGFLKALVDGRLHYLDDLPRLHRDVPHNIAILIDALTIAQENEDQVKESISLSGFESQGEIIVMHGGKEYFFSERLYCAHCNLSLKEPEPATFSLNSPAAACAACRGRGFDENHGPCASCGGTGFKRESLCFYFRGKNIFELGEMEVGDLLDFFEDAKPDRTEEPILAPIVPQIVQRLAAFIKLNLGYITLNRKIHTLSGGELQRTRLVSQVGFGLAGIIYILDEPSIGMHLCEQENLLRILKRLKEKDNTIIVVEHDETTIRSADYVVDLGPGCGEAGGRVVFSGWSRDLGQAADSLTADYLFAKKSITVEKKYRPGGDGSIELKGICINNLENVDVRIPLQALTVVTGVSGSGKSSLIIDALYPIIAGRIRGSEIDTRRLKYRAVNVGGPADNCELGRVLMVDQSAIGKNSRSCPATYINLMPHIRELFAGLMESKIKGYSASRFSFNVRGGRCEACRGLGYKQLEMSFLPRLEVVCPVCAEKRYNSETLLCKYKGLSIADVLNLTAAEAYRHFQDIPPVAKKIKVLCDVGLGYLKLGQGSPSLSGGESQRIRLSRELARVSGKPTLYLLDEPTIGLHFADIQNLVDVLSALVARGNTVVVIEHNMEIIKAADYIVDLGPGGGKNGGKILYQGKLAGIVTCKESVTGRYLKQYLEN